MSTKGRTEEGTAKQYDSVRSLYLDAAVADRVEMFARSNAMSGSSVYREAMQRYLGGDVVPGRKRVTRRITLWLDLAVWSQFRKKAKREGITQAQALERGLEDIL